ncbi:MAG: hypothetical protein HQK52_19445 [Oligoflexia bacterium]|nr:hypothetical protein [Oligoflexia bacterium]
MEVSYSIENDRLFQEAINRAIATTQDLRIPLTLISKDFFKSEQAIWMLQSRGEYPDLAESTKRKRERDQQPYYPILYRTGKLKSSMTNPTDYNCINEIINKKMLIIGTRLEYGKYHQRGTSKMPMRKFLFVGPETKKYAQYEIQGRTERWLNILNDFVMKKLKKEMSKTKK